jgi:nicotinate-nucleotide adenylyltransferase
MKVYLGGTFDPVHNGHIHLAKELASKLRINKLYLMPCFSAVHKETVSANAMLRLDMLNIAISSYPDLAVDRREIIQSGPSHTFESLASIRVEEAGNSVCFVMGVDSLLSFSGWHKANEIHKLANLIVIERPANSFNISEELLLRNRLASLESLKELGFTFLRDSENLAQYSHGKVVVLKLALHDISSTEIRNLIKKRKEITHLVGTGVAEYIQTHKLYQ